MKGQVAHGNTSFKWQSLFEPLHITVFILHYIVYATVEYTDISPRLSTLYYSASVQVASMGYPQGLFSVVLKTTIGGGNVMEPATVTLVVTRTGLVQNYTILFLLQPILN